MNTKITNIEYYYNIKLEKIEENENFYSKTEFYKNRNYYSENLKGEVLKLNISENSIYDLQGLIPIANTLTHLKIDRNELSEINDISSFKALEFLDLSANNISDISPISKLENLLNLYLDGNNISFIPKLHLPKLSELWLYGNKINEIENISTLKNLIVLNLSNNFLRDLKPLFSFKKLSRLDLGNNKIENIDGLENLKNLRSVSIDKNSLSDISVFSKIAELDSLNISDNQIEDISPLQHIKINEELLIGQNKIIDLGPLYPSLKNKKINFVNAFENPLIFPPQDVYFNGEEYVVKWFEMVAENVKICKKNIEKARINNETKLDLGMMGLTNLDFIPELFELEKLEELILSNHYAEYNEKSENWDKVYSDNNFYPNNLEYIPLDIKKLTNLKKLIIGGDWKNENLWNRWRIKDIAHIFSLKNLEYLNVSNNNIEKILVKNSQKLPNLKIIHLNNNKLTTFNTLTKFPNLQELYLSNNKLNTVTNLKNILSLKTIDLHTNKIKSIKPLLNLLEKTDIDITNSKWLKKTINIRDNPLKEPNYETINTGKEAVIRYFESEWKTVVNKELKLVLVGNSEAGKTTLVNYLAGEKDLNKPHDATHWMVERDIPSKEVIKKIGEKCNMRVFDFGGQDYYHDTHQIFFTKNTIYFILWEKKTNNLETRQLYQKVNGSEKNIETQDYPVEYWLESIKHFIKEKSNIVVNDKISYEFDSSVLTIQNKVSKANDIEHLNNSELKSEKKYPFIYDFINVDILDRRNLNHFDFLLSEIINDMKTIGSNILEYQHIIRTKLNNYNEKQILTFKEFINYCNKNLAKNISEDEAKDLCSYLKQLGLIFHLHDYSKVYLNKEWVFTSIYKILDGLFDFNGEFDRKYISDLLGLDSENELIVGLLQLMEEFKIIFTNPINNKYIAPLYLPKEPSDGVSLFLLENRLPYRRFDYNGFIHKTFILDFFNRYGKKTIGDGKKFYYWKDGLIIKDDITEQILHIKFKNGKNNDKQKSNACIDIFKLNNSDKENIFVSEVIDYIKEINNKFFKLEQKDIEEKKINIEDYYEEMVTVNNVDFVSLKLLNENAEKKKFVFSERKIVDKKEEKNLSHKDIRVIDYKQYLENKNMINKLFISYSKKDLVMVNRFQDHLSALERDKLLNTWYCTELRAGEKWDENIQNHFDESNIICFMISPNFMKTNYIFEYEVKKAIERKKKDKDFIIIPIIMDFCIWDSEIEDFNLSTYTALPYTAKPIADFENENAAWLIVTECLKTTLKNKQQPKGDLFFDEKKYYNNNRLRELFERLIKGELNKK
ncbi:leucine-rich repeat domain-containing protein [Chryseobacterium echinoideorum]|uniref:leucine-rich repeat domain-containing protein n=1 Tax=Chryseobacterium echinoideorum TaxID=1549648 RepID=UPI00118665FC|nr:leucine-rich repeat domain-containing protein [Chryseobacterium echinoideorum]